MGISTEVDDRGIAEVVMDNPPVNALTVAGWFEVARQVRAAGDDPEVRAVVLRAEGKGFNAGVDIKEMQATEGYGALIGANRGCYEAFAAVYECKVPVIAAVNGFCVGGGIGLVGNADVIVASDDATSCATLRSRWRRRSRPSRPPSSGRPRSRSTASTSGTSSAATASSRASPSSSTSAGWPTSTEMPLSRSETRT